jgi:RNA polymerase sigma factor (sigma-70 family)
MPTAFPNEVCEQGCVRGCELCRTERSHLACERKIAGHNFRMLSLTNGADDDGTYVPKDFEDWREIPSEALERSEMRDALANALALLEEHYRVAFVLRDVNELSITETANVLGITRGAVKTRLRRARLMLRDILLPELQQRGQVALAFKEARKPWE